MLTINETLDLFLSLTANFSGSQPSFRVNYDKRQIEIVDACSGFIKILYSNENIIAHLHNGILSVQFFAR